MIGSVLSFDMNINLLQNVQRRQLLQEDTGPLVKGITQQG